MPQITEGAEIRKPKSSEAAKKAKLLSTSKGGVLDCLEIDQIRG